MTLIICKRIDCRYIKNRTDKRYQCNLSPIEIGQDKKCVSYMQMPEQAVETDAESRCPICKDRILGQGHCYNPHCPNHCNA